MSKADIGNDAWDAACTTDEELAWQEINVAQAMLEGQMGFDLSRVLNVFGDRD